ncbi:unnamed protein product [Amaranthus hypochondriacus]
MNTNNRGNTLVLLMIIVTLLVSYSVVANIILQETNKEKCINEHKAANEEALKAAKDYLDKQKKAYEQAQIDYDDAIGDYDRLQQEIMAYPPKTFVRTSTTKYQRIITLSR